MSNLYFVWQRATTVTADWFADRKFEVTLSATPTSSNDCEIYLAYTEFANTVIPRLTKIIRSGITFVSRNLR